MTVILYYCGQESLRRNGVALIVNKSPKCSTWMQSQKWQDGLCVQGKPFSVTVIQVCAPTNNAEEAEVEWFYEDLQGLLELTPKKDVLFFIGDWNAKVGSQEITWSNRQIWPWSTEWNRTKANRVLPRTHWWSSPITSWQIDGETVETVRNFILGAPKSLQMVAAVMKLKDACSLEEKLWST